MAADNQAPNSSPLDFIGDGKWEKALFTSYALSLTYFETYVLPKLRQAGCEKIWVLIDADGYRSSLMELRSRYVGQEYSLIPISVRSGIFHPKLTYLWGEDEDLLMVGSGNLTFGGHGHNLEVLEVLSTRTDAKSFLNFATMCDGLLAREDIYIADQAPLQDFRARAEKRSRTGNDIGRTQLLHSLFTSIADQLVEQAKMRNDWTEMLVLSPFHNPDGIPIRDVAKELNIEKVYIGVPESGDDHFSFPFDKAAEWGAEIAIVTPKVEKSNRKLHAKWLELRGSETWSLTGSVNATMQSMGSIRNVEVGVLRILDEPTFDLWKKTKKPKYQLDIVRSSDVSSTLVVYGELDENGLLSGIILGSSDFEGDWNASLELGDEIKSEDTLHVEQNGVFQWKLKELLEFDAANSPQLRLVKGSQVARGWIGIQTLLKLPSRSRNAIGALNRMLNRSESQDDIRALLDYIAIHSGRLVSENVPRKQSEKDSDNTKSVPDSKTSVESLYLHEGDSEVGILRGIAAVAEDEGRTWEVLQTITKLLVGRSITSAGTRAFAHCHHDTRVIEDEHDERELLNTREALKNFDAQLMSSIQSDELAGIRKSQLLFVCGNVELDMLLRRLESPNDALAFSKHWLLTVIRANIPPGDRKLIDDTVYGIAAALALYSVESTNEAQLYFGITTTKQLVHEWLESYCCGDVPVLEALQLSENWFSHETPRMLVDGNAQAALTALERALETQTTRRVLDNFCKDLESDKPYFLPEHYFSSDEMALLKTASNQNRGRHNYHSVDHHSVKSCPNTRSCGVALNFGTLITLRSRRISQCVNCKQVMISTAP